jgi:hypothetical protein
VCAVWGAEENGISGTRQRAFGAAETGSRQASAPTWATEILGQ